MFGFGLSMLFNPKVLAGLGIAALVAMYGTYTWGYDKGYELAALRGQREVTRLVTEYQNAVNIARKQIAAKNAELEEMQKDYIRMSEQRLRKNKELQESLDEYKAKLADRPECGLTDDDVDSVPAR
jgi:hypothetical protein